MSIDELNAIHQKILNLFITVPNLKQEEVYFSFSFGDSYITLWINQD